jgi:hypothetical protein
VTRRMLSGALVSVVLASPAWSADSLYRHEAGFSLLVPDGWTTEVQQLGLNVVKEPAYVSAFVVEGRGGPAGLLEAIVSRVSRRWRSWQESRRGGCKLGGARWRLRPVHGRERAG